MNNSLVNPFKQRGQWYKAALHSHVSGPDGGMPVEELASLYRAAGYDVLVIMDHERTIDLRGLGSKDFLVINGIELHPLYPGHPVRNHHVLGIGVPHGYPTSRAGQRDLRACIEQIVDLGGVAVMTHPHGVDIPPQLVADMPVDAYELFATRQEFTGGGNREDAWAKGLDEGIYLPAIASDDTHEPSHINQAWTMLKMTSLTTKAVLKAIRTGACYGSTGPEINTIAVTADTVEVRSSAAATITLVGPAGQCDTRQASPTGRITTHTIPRPDWPFVRAVITDRKGKRAWSNPIILN